MKDIADRIDALFAAYTHSDSPGCALGIFHHGETIYKRGYGMASLEYAVPITPATIFHVASVSKQFTAMAVALLETEGKLQFDAPVQEYLPELPNLFKSITLRQLLQHTSGLRDQWELLILAGWRMDDVITTDDILDLLHRQRELNFSPGTDYLYSNSGFTLAGQVVARVSGKSLRAFCQEHIFTPLGMLNTHFHDDHNEIVHGQAYSYTPKAGGGYQKAVLSFATAGATSLFTSVEDLGLWEENFYTGMVGGVGVLKQMQTPGILDSGESFAYGLGLITGRYRGLRIVEHPGGDAGFRAHLMRFPEEHFSVAILANLSTIRPGQLAREVADCCLEEAFNERGKRLSESELSVSGGLPLEDLERYVGVYYQANRHESRRLELHDGKLVFHEAPELYLQPFTKDRFKFTDYLETIVEFFRDPMGGVASMSIVQPTSAPVMYQRIQPAVPNRSELDAYVGWYYSPELGVTYQVVLQGENLGILRRKYGFSTLAPTVLDGFSGDSFDITFNRGKGGSIIGLMVTTERVRNLRFRRIQRFDDQSRLIIWS